VADRIRPGVGCAAHDTPRGPRRGEYYLHRTGSALEGDLLRGFRVRVGLNVAALSALSKSAIDWRAQCVASR
jgi:hypothetical protein